MLYYVFIFWVIFQNIILRFLPNVFSYWDELACLLFTFWYFFENKGKIKKSDFSIFLLLQGLIIIGLIGNIAFQYQSSYGAIVKDIIGTIKFPLSFICLYRLKITNNLVLYTKKIIPVLKAISYITFMCGILSIFINLGMNQEEIRGLIHPYMFIYTHPTYLTSGMICILCVLNSLKEVTVKDDVVILGNIALAMRTKGLAFIAVYVFLKYGYKWLRKFKYLYWIVIIIIVLVVTKSKLLLYVSFSNSPRESLYKGMIELIKKCFPIGTGFGTYASFVSVKYMSNVYKIIHIAGLYNGDNSVTPVIGDAGLPFYIGQFGIFGVICFVILTIKLIKLSLGGINGKNRLPIIYMWLMLAISLPTEAILVNNGFEMAFIIVLISKIINKNLMMTEYEKRDTDFRLDTICNNKYIE